MHTADDVEHLIWRIHQDLLQAGFAADPNEPAVDADLRIRYDPDRGVVVSWAASAESLTRDPPRHHRVRTAVHLALRAVLTDAGHRIADDHADDDLVIPVPARSSQP
ncbi:hypothetical protein ACFFMN_18330 [Planobispora siamensis]|uniref:Uncharacterized protein n=1 Tax=Planobispora siamensis TaxID=936338 RepID=A0A8J3SGS6_9ACTN|nr:hypothetical protein [Planobispora siamensis]GIH92215.1 hypothetical protein Psi01_28450 [Planobispora siamensis]